MERQRMRQLGKATAEILENKAYNVNGQTVDLASLLSDATASSVLYTPDSLYSMEVPDIEQVATVFEVTPETTLSAAARLIGLGHNTAALNFASAKNPGGGFLSGARAQEESLARSSGLYATLTANSAYYSANKPTRDCIYTDHLIWSPWVPVIRSEAAACELLPGPWLLNFLTCPATNAGEAAKRWNPKTDQAQRSFTEVNDEVMTRRIRNVLKVALAHKQEALVLGAWGCGAFGNAPLDVARLFHRQLVDGDFKGAFKHVTFAVFVGKKGEDANLKAFQDVFKDVNHCSIF